MGALNAAALTVGHRGTVHRTCVCGADIVVHSSPEGRASHWCAEDQPTEGRARRCPASSSGRHVPPYRAS